VAWKLLTRPGKGFFALSLDCNFCLGEHFMTTPQDVIKTIKEQEVKFVDFRFTDTRGKDFPIAGCPGTPESAELRCNRLVFGSRLKTSPESPTIHNA